MGRQRRERQPPQWTGAHRCASTAWRIVRRACSQCGLRLAVVVPQCRVERLAVWCSSLCTPALLRPRVQTLPDLLASRQMTGSPVGLEDDWIDVRVARTWREAADIVALELRGLAGSTLPAFEAGAYIDVLTPSGYLRPYSLCNSPAENDRYVVAVLREHKGRGGSIDLHEHVRSGDTLRIRGPRNEFPLALPALYSLLLAGGIGVTPLLAMADQLWRRGSPFALHYCARNPERAAFASTILSQPYAGQVHLHWSESSGRMDLSRLMHRAPHGSHVYVCGPSRFTRDAAAAFSASGRAMTCWHEESFCPLSPVHLSGQEIA